MSRKVSNENHVTRIVRRLYADAQKSDWEHLSTSAKTAQYSTWIEHPEVGELLQQWMGAEEARVWIKDGPMKEYARALAGFGPFADYLDAHPRGPKAAISAAFGDGWSVVPESSGVKPLHCDAEKNDSRVRLYWGPMNDFKHLLWAALVAVDRAPALDTRIAVFHTVAHPTPRPKRMRHERIGRRCGFKVMHIRL
jgi:hypothetical protein